ncbi:MAG: hypothetical protein GY705_17520, partial [Bacteroidetes bacterium]|nr:hypothetical protein [Bacteroidota bacterium]
FLFCAFFFYHTGLAQRYSMDISAGPVYSRLRHFDYYHETYQYYLAQPVIGYEGMAQVCLPLFWKMDAIGGLGYVQNGFEGRRYEGLVTGLPDSLTYLEYRHETWSIYRMHNISVSAGLKFSLHDLIITAAIKGLYRYKVTEKRQEIHLTDFFGGNIFFEPEKHKATHFQDTDFGLETSLEYRMYKNLFLKISFYLGKRDIVNRHDLNYWFEMRSIFLGIRYAGVFPQND